MKSKYTIHGSQEIDAKVEADLQIVKEAVLAEFPEKDIKAIVLGGGYGRGEGGVWFEDKAEMLFNDYDFFIFTSNLSKGKLRKFRRKLSALSEKLTEQIGIEVDFSSPVPVSKIPNIPFHLMWYELQHGYIYVYNSYDILQEIPKYYGFQMPQAEALKLLLNRAMGLLLCEEYIDGDWNRHNREFVERNCKKAIMAAGDALMMMRKIYHFSYTERKERFCKLEYVPNIDLYELIKEYLLSIEYKLKPSLLFESREELKEYYNNTIRIFSSVYLQVFSEYYGKNELNFDEYVKCIARDRKYGFNVVNLLKNSVKNRFIDKIRIKSVHWSIHHPRQRLYLAVPYLLGILPPDRNVLKVMNSGNLKAMKKKALNIWRKYC